VQCAASWQAETFNLCNELAHSVVASSLHRSTFAKIHWLPVGAFVAGLDAGRAYNTFPLMNGRLIPKEYFSVDGWRNAFESTAAVQLHHRALALTTLTATVATWWSARGLVLPPQCRKLLAAVALMSSLQVSLGVATLLTYVPPTLGSLHQTGALVLFSLTVGLLHSLRLQPRLGPQMAAVATPAALALVAGVSTWVITCVDV
jgi:heme a synthase